MADDEKKTWAKLISLNPNIEHVDVTLDEVTLGRNEYVLHPNAPCTAILSLKISFQVQLFGVLRIIC